MFRTTKISSREVVCTVCDSAGRANSARKYFSEANWKLLGLIEEIAQEMNTSISQIAIAWLLANPAITSPIIGPRNPEQLKDNLGSLEIELTKDQINTLNEASRWD